MDKKRVITSREGEREARADDMFSLITRCHLLLEVRLRAARLALASGPAAPDWPRV